MSWMITICRDEKNQRFAFKASNFGEPYEDVKKGYNVRAAYVAGITA
jgi:hypothetical protein